MNEPSLRGIVPSKQSQAQAALKELDELVLLLDQTTNELEEQLQMFLGPESALGKDMDRTGGYIGSPFWSELKIKCGRLREVYDKLISIKRRIDV